jgi:hypothetical protein
METSSGSVEQMVTEQVRSTVENDWSVAWSNGRPVVFNPLMILSLK